MIKIIAGEKGKGKTKIILDKANSDVLTSGGSIIYIDKNNKHMYELNNKIRLINVNDYFVQTADEFIGFISGIISQNHDISTIYLDSFLTLAAAKVDDLDDLVERLERVSSAFSVNLVLSVSSSPSKITGNAKNNIIVAL